MEQKDLNRLTMWKTVFKVLHDNQNVWNSNLGFSESVMDLKGFIDAADAVAGIHAVVTTGITADKETLGEIAIDRTLRVTKVARAYARKSGNQILFAAVDFSKGTLQKLSFTELGARLKNMLDAAVAVERELLTWGLVQDSATDAVRAIDAFNTAAPGTRTAISGRKAVTATLPQIMRGGKAELLVLDDLVGLYQDGAPHFVGTYKAARNVVDAGRRKEKPLEAIDDQAAMN